MASQRAIVDRLFAASARALSGRGLVVSG